MPTRIQPTVNALSGDLDPKKGADLIGKWEADLEKADWRGAKTIHADLVALKKQLEGGAPDGAKIKELLGKLGQETLRAANHVEGATGQQLQELGRALEQAGSGL
jgi:hypothetical protein